MSSISANLTGAKLAAAGLGVFGLGAAAGWMLANSGKSATACAKSSKAGVGAAADANAKSYDGSNVDWDDSKAVSAELERVFDELVEEWLDETAKVHGIKPKLIARLRNLCHYTCKGGKMNRALLCVGAARDVSSDQAAFLAIAKKAIVLAWCIEILQACFLVADDIMDKSTTRRGQPCWYKLEEIQLDAINDTLILESFIYFLLQSYFKADDPAKYVQLVDMYHEVSYQTQLGQMMDLVSQPQGRKGPEILADFSADLHRQIVVLKTAYYSFYLPIASGMILGGNDDAKALDVAKQLCVELGEKFQIEDDYLDCFGVNIGKIGTDIQDHKCTWLVVQALLRMNAQQRKNLELWYGKEDEATVEKVKQLYRDLGLEQVYLDQEKSSYDRIAKLIHDNKTMIPVGTFEWVLEKIHLRKK